MDRPTHARFLTYLEAWEYFRPPGHRRLDRASWQALDAELEMLLAKAGHGELDRGERERLRALARELFRD